MSTTFCFRCGEIEPETEDVGQAAQQCGYCGHVSVVTTETAADILLDLHRQGIMEQYYPELYNPERRDDDIYEELEFGND